MCVEIGSTEARELREEIQHIIATTPDIGETIERNPFLRIAFTISANQAQREARLLQ